MCSLCMSKEKYDTRLETNSNNDKGLAPKQHVWSSGARDTGSYSDFSIDFHEKSPH